MGVLPVSQRRGGTPPLPRGHHRLDYQFFVFLKRILPYRALAFLVVIRAGEGALGGGEQVVLDLGIVLVLEHGAVVDVQQGGDNDHHQGQDAVIVEGDLAQEHADTGAGEAVGHIGRDSGGPGGHRRQHAHGGRSGVDNIGQLGAGNLVALGDGTHHGAHGQAVEVVVDEDQHAQEHGHQLRAGAGLHGLGSPAAEGCGAAGLVHQVHHDAQNHQEDQDGDIVGDRVNQANTGAAISADEVDNHLPGGEICEQQGCSEAPEEQGRVHFLADKGQRDCDHGGEQRPAGRLEAGTIVRQLGDDQGDHDDDKGNAVRNLGTFLFHNCDLPPQVWYCHLTRFLNYCQDISEVFHFLNKL